MQLTHQYTRTLLGTEMAERYLHVNVTGCLGAHGRLGAASARQADADFVVVLIVHVTMVTSRSELSKTCASEAYPYLVGFFY